MTKIIVTYSSSGDWVQIQVEGKKTVLGNHTLEPVEILKYLKAQKILPPKTKIIIKEEETEETEE